MMDWEMKVLQPVTTGFQTPCGDKRRLDESFPPNAPQRKLWKGSGEDVDKENDDMRKL